jgi:hypothetical protein
LAAFSTPRLSGGFPADFSRPFHSSTDRTG